MKKILIVDDHPAIRIGIGELICNRYREYSYMEARNEEEFLQLVKNNEFELIILDINIPDTNTLDLIDWLMLRNRQTKILVFSMYPYNRYGIQYYKKGVMGYVNKEASNAELLRAVDLILNNRIYMAQDFQDTISKFLVHKKDQADFASLSEREFAVAQCLAKGMPYEDIAEVLNISTSTVRTFKLRIFNKLGIKTLFDFLALVKNDPTLGRTSGNTPDN